MYQILTEKIMSNIEWIGVSPLAQEYVVNTPTGKGKGKATVKKMVIADPGLGVEVTFEADSGEVWKNVKMRFDLYVVDDGAPIPAPGDTPDHFVEFGIHNGPDQLVMPATYSFVVPFADRDWSQEMEEGKNLYYRFRFAIEEPTSEWGLGEIRGVPTGSIKENEKFDFEPRDVGNPVTKGEVTYSFVTKNDGAVAWHENYYNDATYTSIRDTQTTKESYFLPFDASGGDHSHIEENVTCVLPVPELTTGPIEMDILRTNNGAQNWDYDLENAHSISGAISIKLVSVN